ncbi:MAG TPA: Stp1/IreP family PP2C-type Ser/Thr phosphatase [Ktedonobacterales bacterium]
MTRQLRLASGVQTDVGRKRERNQDNVTSYVPTDPETLAERGALFVVCDGMGGHAAGEVASELGVNTIREVYFASQGQDVISSIAQSVKSANDAIYSLARARTEYSGMGTTCVTLVIAGGRAYIVNIGDSRAYIIRDGDMRQVTQDHSWVAEQVRIGLLTEEQARVHAHRNVITRSLGTQPNITADLFVETLRDGDRVLMCSDGLHGYVEEAAIKQEVLTQSSADEAVKNLIDMANANGGPDNISAIVVDILEAPEVSGPIPLPDNADEPIEEGATQPLPVPASVTPAAAAAAAATTTATTTALKAAKPAKRVRRRRELYALRFLEAVAILLVLFAGWYVAFGPLAAQRAVNQQAQDRLTSARRLIQQASSQPPSQALTALAQARTLALTEANDTAIDPSVKSQAQSLLTQELAPAVQQALQRYNTAALIVPVKGTSTVPFSISCATPTSSAPTAITSMSGLVPVSTSAGKPALVSGQQPIYFISGGSLYEALIPVDVNNTPTAGTTSCALVAVKGVSSFLSIAADGATAYALAQDAAGGYSVISVETDPVVNGAPTMKTTTLFTVPVTQETPTHLAVAGANFFVSYASGATTPFGVWLFNGQPKTPGGPATSAQTISLPAAAASLLAANNSLYILLNNGAIGQLDPTHIYASLAVVAQPPAATIDPSTYTSATPVPTVQNTDATPTSAVTSTPTIGEVFTADANLAADPLMPSHVLLSDPAHDRVLGLGTNTNAPGVTLLSQYVYSAPIANVGVLAVTGSGTTLNAFAWSDGKLLTFPVPESTHS